jgi:hypothetical protein
MEFLMSDSPVMLVVSGALLIVPSFATTTISSRSGKTAYASPVVGRATSIGLLVGGIVAAADHVAAGRHLISGKGGQPEDAEPIHDRATDLARMSTAPAPQA